MDGFDGMSTHLGHVMPKRTMSKTMEKSVKNITPSEDPHLNIVRFKVCIGDLTNSNFLEKYHAYHNKTINSLQNIVSIIIEQLTV